MKQCEVRTTKAYGSAKVEHGEIITKYSSTTIKQNISMHIRTDRYWQGRAVACCTQDYSILLWLMTTNEGENYQGAHEDESLLALFKGSYIGQALYM